jgi:alkylation response protein AidB-like acyl-CoA dehydrogenase
MPQMAIGLTSDQEAIRDGVAELCRQFPGQYWRDLDREQAYPEEFVAALTEGGWLAALIPEEYGGMGLGLADAALILQEINRQGCNSGACHAQMYIMGTILRHGSEEQKRRYLPAIAAGELRLQAFGVTEPDAGSNTLALRTRADRRPDGGWLVNGQKIWTSRFAHSDLMLLLARTSTPAPGERRTGGLSTFLVDLRQAGDSIDARPIRTLMNHATVELFIKDLALAEDALVGEEGKGFSYILDGMNAERILIAAECVGDGHWFIERASAYARERIVFERPIGQNQGVQFPLARAHAAVAAADLMRWRAAELFDAGLPCGPEANMAKLLASEASWEAANACLNTHGGFGFAEEYDVERKFRENRLYQVAPVSNNLILAFLGQNVLGMPRSY